MKVTVSGPDLAEAIRKLPEGGYLRIAAWDPQARLDQFAGLDAGIPRGPFSSDVLCGRT
jgi:hypothetical protein